MAKPIFHAISSARRWGGEPEEYLALHQLMDSSKSAMPDNRHRALTHNGWFVGEVLERLFGVARTNSAGRVVPTRSLGEQHVLEDYGGRFIPSLSDYLAAIPPIAWRIAGPDERGGPAAARAGAEAARDGDGLGDRDGDREGDRDGDGDGDGWSTPAAHARRSAERWGGAPADYEPIHRLMDAPRVAVADWRHRAATHQTWFVDAILEGVFGATLATAAGPVPVRAVGAQHVRDDLGRLASVQDWLAVMPFADWLDNGRSGVPPSHRLLVEHRRSRVHRIAWDGD